MFLLTSFVLYATLALQVAYALPLVKRIVVDPPITSPSAGTVWTPGQTQTVTWYEALSNYRALLRVTQPLPTLNFRDTSVIPPTGNFTGMILLGHQTPGSENLDVGMHPPYHVSSFLPLLTCLFSCFLKDNPLANDFDLRVGSVTVTCPDVPDGTNYIVVCESTLCRAQTMFV
jgi:hypothetical protein